MKYNYDACCDNCSHHTRKGECRQALNVIIDYSNNDNPFCWHWNRKLTSMIAMLLRYLKKEDK